MLSASGIGRVVLTHLLSIVGFIMATILLARASHQRRATASTLAWLLAVVLVPYVGVPFYLLFGGRKVARSASPATPTNVLDTVAAARLARMLCASGAPAPSAGNRVELLGDGEAAFTEVMERIDGAARSVHLSTLVFAGDEVGEAVCALLEKKARAGVEVRILIDGLFKFRSKRRQIARLRTSGAKVAWFKRFWTLPTRGSMNLRLHRKEIIIDGQVAIVGGMNIAREYMGPTPLVDRWRDLSLTITGPAAADVASVFRADWAFACGEKVVGAPPAPPAPHEDHPASRCSIQVVTSGPDSENDRIYDAFLSAIFDAKRRVWIATPYFVPDEAIVHALLLAIRRGVEVQILVPLRSNHRTADLAGAASLRDLRDVGAVIRCFEPGMMHAKILLVDDDVGILGSANMDRRSFFLDYEIALVITAPEEVARMEAWFFPIFEKCVDLPPAGRLRTVLEPIVRLLAPLE